MYTDDKNAQIVLSLLKQFGIKKIVVSPGMTNVPISRSVQIDPWFEVYSVVDERSAAYFASGLAYESGEPVVISCTGATASRNYLPGLTEAYYRNLPIIALTSQRHTSDFGNLVPQITDRTVSQNDIKKISVQLPYVRDDEDYERCIISVNKALISATTRGRGPVHINLPVDSFTFSTDELPMVRKIDYIDGLSFTGKVVDNLHNELNGKKVAVFVGSHHKFDPRLASSLEAFALKYNAAVIIDQTSSYKGKNKILLAQIADLAQSANKPELIIDMGSVTGEYSIDWLFGIETWRISEEGEIHDRLHNQTKLFDCPEWIVFDVLAKVDSVNTTRYYDELATEVKALKVPDMIISNTLVSYELSRNIPKNSSLHLGILNSLRNMNLFNLDESIDVSSNVGGFGIDGPLSTLIGQSMVNRKKLTFGLVGDLAAFYDMNALGIRHIGDNVRIIIVNNNGGVEFRLNVDIETQLADATNEFISASGHNGSMKAWAEAMGFVYITASTSQELREAMKTFCSPSLKAFTGPVLFEVFTSVKDEQDSLNLIRKVNSREHRNAQPSESTMNTKKAMIKSVAKKIAPEIVKRAYKKVRRG